MNEPVFLDASFWIAYRDERQEWHDAAKAILRRIFQNRCRIVTTLPVLCEIHAHFARHRLKKEMVLTDFWNNPVVQIEGVTTQDEERAIELLRQHRDKSYSLCDATSFVTMRRLGLNRALAFDDHFRLFGEFEIVA